MKKKILITMVSIIIIISTVLLCSCNNNENSYQYVEDPIVFYIDELRVGPIADLIGDMFTLVDKDAKTGDLTPLLNKSSSMIYFDTDGTCALIIAIDEKIIPVIEIFLNAASGTSLGISALIDSFLISLFPGFNATDASGSFQLIEESLGLSISGIDYDDPRIVELLDTGILPQGLNISNNLAIKIQSEYQLINNENNTKTVYFGKNYDKDAGGEPFLLMTMYKDENGKDAIKSRIEFVSTDIHATVK